ncbi:MAG: hypothetical protein GXO55_09665 [Chloroflexi bacterium]|nr:hypothetical protein [Chloroflexota bacterium]
MKRYTYRRIILTYPDTLSPREAALFAKRQEHALKRVEKLLRLRHQNDVRIHIKITPFREHYVNKSTIYYSFPIFEFQQIIENNALLAAGELHELTHYTMQEFVPTKILRPDPPGFFLIEGLAIAVDAMVDRQEASFLHLLAKGAFLLGALKPMLQIQPSDPPFLRYEITGSFTLFLIERYGIDKLKNLYKFVSDDAFSTRVTQILRKSLFELEKDWLIFLEGYPEKYARYIASASLDLNGLYELPIMRYGNRWFRQGLIGHMSKSVYSQMSSLYKVYSALGRADTLCRFSQLYELFQNMLNIYYASLQSWQEAAESFREAQQILSSQHANCNRILALLKRAYSLFRKVGDIVMMRQVRLYVAFVLLKMKGESLEGDHSKALGFLREASDFLDR